MNEDYVIVEGVAAEELSFKHLDYLLDVGTELFEIDDIKFDAYVTVKAEGVEFLLPPNAVIQIAHRIDTESEVDEG